MLCIKAYRYAFLKFQENRSTSPVENMQSKQFKLLNLSTLENWGQFEFCHCALFWICMRCAHHYVTSALRGLISIIQTQYQTNVSVFCWRWW